MISDMLPVETNKNPVFDYYTQFRNEQNSALKIGLFDQDLDSAIANPLTINYKTYNNETELELPVLVPTNDLEWYNQELLGLMFPGKIVYAYAHPPSYSENDDISIREILKDAINDGFVVVAEKYESDSSSVLARFITASNDDEKVSVDRFGDQDLPSSVDFFDARAEFSVSGSNSDKSLYEVYEQLVAEGLEVPADQDGVSLCRIIDGDDADNFWELYKKPFDELGKNDPTKAGFDEVQLKDLLSNPDVIKVVNKLDGEITTLLLVIDNLKQVPWFSEDYFKEKYPEQYEDKNILISPGIVSDEDKRGNNYAVDVLDFLSRVYARRGANVILSFECTQISTQYIPKIVKIALEKSGMTFASGLDAPVDTIEYFGIKKVS
jgi:hypothetical protein